MTGGRVLLVDDDEQMRSSTAQALRLAGFQVEVLTGGEEALASPEMRSESTRLNSSH